MYKLFLTGFLLISLASCQSASQDSTATSNNNAATTTKTVAPAKQQVKAPSSKSSSEDLEVVKKTAGAEKKEAKKAKPASINPNQPNDQTLEGRAQGISRLHCLCKDMKIETRREKCYENVKSRLEKAYETYPNDVKTKLTARYNELILTCGK